MNSHLFVLIFILTFCKLQIVRANDDKDALHDEKQGSDNAVDLTPNTSTTSTTAPASANPTAEPSKHNNETKADSNLNEQPKSGDANKAASPVEATKNQDTIDEHKMQSFEEWKHMRIKEQQADASASTASTGSSQQANSAQPTITPLVQQQQQQQRVVHKKNFASMDCGAKVLNANPEASGASHILTESKDDYMLNSCSNKIWFIVELCEPIQITDIEIANYELFSNVPKQFRIYASERYSIKNWTKALYIGTFDAQPVRTLQLFHVDQDVHKQSSSLVDSVDNKQDDHQHQQQQQSVYVKYVKFEMLSHYGNEHFCPLSLVRIYGVTLVDDDVDNQVDSVESGSDPIPNDNTVNKPSMDNGDTGFVEQQKDANKTTGDDVASKSDIIDIAYKAINNIIISNADVKPTASTSTDQLVDSSQTRNLPTITSTSSETTQPLAEQKILTTTIPNPSTTQPLSSNEPVHQPTADTIKTVGSMPTTDQQQIAISNSTNNSTQQPSIAEKEKDNKLKFFSKFLDNLVSFFMRYNHSHSRNPTVSHSNEPLVHTSTKQSASKSTTPINDQLANKNSDDTLLGLIYKTLLCSYSNTNHLCCQCLINETESFHSFCTYYFIILNTCKNVYTQFAYKYEQSIKQFIDLNLISNGTNNYTNYTAVNINNISYFILNDLLFSINDTQASRSFTSSQQQQQQPHQQQQAMASTTAMPSTTPSEQQQQHQQQQQQNKAQQKQQPIQIQPITTNTNTKDVLFMRLSNRIRSLELNMSLSGQYLEQLSQHYRKQIDEMQKIFNKTTMSLNNTVVLIDDYNLKQQNQIKAIENRLDRLDYQLNLFLNYFSSNLTLGRTQHGRTKPKVQSTHESVYIDPKPSNTTSSGNNVYLINNEVLLLLVLILVLNTCLFIVLFVYVRVRMRTCTAISKNRMQADEMLIRNLVNKYLMERIDLRSDTVKPVEYEEIGVQSKIDNANNNGNKCGAAVVVMAAVAAAAVASPSSLTQMNTNT